MPEPNEMEPKRAEPKTRGMSRAGKVVLGLVLGLVGLVAALGVAFVVLTKTENGRAFLVRRVEDAYDAQMEGTMRIGTLERLDGLTADALDVRFRDPLANDVIHVQRVHARIEALPLLEGKLSLREVAADGATVRLARGRTHKLSIQDAFEKGEGKPKRRMEVDTGRMRVRNAEMIVAMGGPTIAVRDLRGLVRVTRWGKDPANVDLANVGGRVTFPDIDILRDRHFRVSGELLAKRTPRLVARVRGCFPRGEFPMYVRMSPGKVFVRFDPSDDHAAGGILRAVGHFSEAVETKRGSVDLHGLSPCGD